MSCSCDTRIMSSNIRDSILRRAANRGFIRFKVYYRENVIWGHQPWLSHLSADNMRGGRDSFPLIWRAPQNSKSHSAPKINFRRVGEINFLLQITMNWKLKFHRVDRTTLTTQSATFARYPRRTPSLKSDHTEDVDSHPQRIYARK